jgi:hypothetical protein
MSAREGIISNGVSHFSGIKDFGGGTGGACHGIGECHKIGQVKSFRFGA